eukprot:11203560-Lingulodinium_polyedra.AAC.1
MARERRVPGRARAKGRQPIECPQPQFRRGCVGPALPELAPYRLQETKVGGRPAAQRRQPSA